jgi:hypothetical protein
MGRAELLSGAGLTARESHFSRDQLSEVVGFVRLSVGGVARMRFEESGA